MNFKQKLGYMFIGCLFTITGYILASLGGGDTTHAQKDEQVLDKIVCKRLEVVNEEGTTVAAIFTTEYGGTIKAYNKTGRLGAGIYIYEDGGIYRLYQQRRQVSCRHRRIQKWREYGNLQFRRKETCRY